MRTEAGFVAAEGQPFEDSVRMSKVLIWNSKGTSGQTLFALHGFDPLTSYILVFISTLVNS